MNKESEIKFKELEKRINEATKEQEIKFIRFPLHISKIRTRLLLLSSITIIGIYFGIEINPEALGFGFKNLKDQGFPIMIFLLISLIYFLIYFIWNIADYIVEYSIGNISKRAFGSFYGEDAKPEETLTGAINSFIQYLKDFLNNQNMPDGVKNNFKLYYLKIGIYNKGLSIFNKSQLLRFYIIEIGLPLCLSTIAIIMIISNLL